MQAQIHVQPHRRAAASLLGAFPQAEARSKALPQLFATSKQNSFMFPSSETETLPTKQVIFIHSYNSYYKW